MGSHEEGKWSRQLENFQGKNVKSGDKVPVVHAWCYICRSSHRWDVPCGSPDPRHVSVGFGEQRTCLFCHKEYTKTTFTRNYCSVECRTRGATVRKRSMR